MTIGRGFPFDKVSRSAAVDLLTFIAGRPAMRLRTTDSARVAAWANAHYLGSADDGEYVIVSRPGIDADDVLLVDRSVEPHTVELGELLGYPRCCAVAAGESGEDALDDLAAGAHRSGLLDISGYRDGVALVSHIPCGLDCAASLRAASAALKVARGGCDDTNTNDRWRSIARRFTDARSITRRGPTEL